MVYICFIYFSTNRIPEHKLDILTYFLEQEKQIRQINKILFIENGFTVLFKN